MFGGIWGDRIAKPGWARQVTVPGQKNQPLQNGKQSCLLTSVGGGWGVLPIPRANPKLGSRCLAKASQPMSVGGLKNRSVQ